MKKKIWAIFLFGVLAILCVFGLTACTDSESKKAIEDLTATYNAKVAELEGEINNLNNKINSINDNLNGLDFYLLADNTYGVKAGKMQGAKEIVIPQEYNGKKVTQILEQGFYNCVYLEKITIPGSLKFVDYYAFEDCDSLTKVNYTGDINGWVQIDFKGSYSNPLHYAKNLYINDVLVKEANITTATKIHDDAFYNCRSLESVTIGNSVESIGYGAFDNCISLQYNEYDNGLYLGNSENKYLLLVKAKSNSITSCIINDKCKFIYDDVFYNCTSLESVIIPNSVTSIGGSVFCYCSSLESVTIGNSVTSIWGWTFSHCTSLKSVTIGNSVTSIGTWAFDGCDALESLTFSDTETWYKTSNSDYTGGEIIDVTNPAENATAFKNYSNYYYYKK